MDEEEAWVLVPDKEHTELRLAKITGRARLKRMDGETFYARPVVWQEAVPFELIPAPLQRRLRPQQTCVEVTDIWEQIRNLFQGGRHWGPVGSPDSRSIEAARGRREPQRGEEYRPPYSVTTDSRTKLVDPRHNRFQIRLIRFLKRRGIQAERERDNVDVQFDLQGKHFIGEIKVPAKENFADEFRCGLGQLLDYSHMLFKRPPRMIMFLNKNLHPKRLQLARSLSISVVVGQHGRYHLVNRQTNPTLGGVFA